MKDKTIGLPINVWKKLSIKKLESDYNSFGSLLWHDYLKEEGDMNESSNTQEEE